MLLALERVKTALLIAFHVTNMNLIELYFEVHYDQILAY